MEYKLRKRETPVPIGKIVESLNGLRTTKIKLDRLPAIYATTGISEEIKQICAALEMTVPEDYENSGFAAERSLLYEKVLEAISRIKEIITTEREKIKKLENPWDSKALLKLSVILL